MENGPCVVEWEHALERSFIHLLEIVHSDFKVAIAK